MFAGQYWIIFLVFKFPTTRI